MAIVTRRYIDVGPRAVDLATFVSAVNTPVIVTQYGRATVDISVDDAVPGLVDDLDAFMASINLTPSDTASPKQVFSYVCTGAEGATIAIGAGQGFVPRVTANYTVVVSMCRPMANAIKIVSLQGAVAVGGFTAELSAPAEAGDVLCFTVEDQT